jgi:hypothetical protein
MTALEDYIPNPPSGTTVLTDCYYGIVAKLRKSFVEGDEIAFVAITSNVLP